MTETDFQSLKSPVSFLGRLLNDEEHERLHEYEDWWTNTGADVSAAVDRGGTPWLRMFDESGKRTDEILFPPDYWRMLRKGYEAGALWRAFEGNSLKPHYLLDFVTCFFDAGLGCPYIVSLSTAVPLKKYGPAELQERFLPQLLKRDGTNWQGATWMTEIKGGSDLGSNVETVARGAGSSWRLNGDKYFASNVGAELAIVAARPEGEPTGPKGLALFLVPRFRDEGQLNYFVRRLKDKIGTRSVPTGEVELRDSEGYLLGKPHWGIYLILESLNLSRVGNIVGSVALAQRALADAVSFAEQRVAFGKPIIRHPLMRQQVEERVQQLREARALMWEAMQLLDEVWQERPPREGKPGYSDRYHLFRLITHLAKYWTAELAVQFAKWNMEVHGGMGVLAEYRAERLLRDAMILPIWEGTPHRQMLDGLEVMERKHAHELLFDHLASLADKSELDSIARRVDEHLRLSSEKRESGIEPLFCDLAKFCARALARKEFVAG
jgi:acyl-CoA dehydrogenase